MSGDKQNPARKDQVEQGGKLLENIMLFARTLRAAGLSVGPGRVLEGIRAVQAVGVGERRDLYWTLNAVFVQRREEQALFDQAFQIFWRNPRLLDRLMGLTLPQTQGDGDRQAEREIARRLADALGENAPHKPDVETDEVRQEFEASLTYSRENTIQTKDFEQMSEAEIAAAKRAIAKLRLPIAEVETRRFQATSRPGKPDMRRTMQAALRHGAQTIPLRHKAAKTRVPPLVMICDISGSMAQYSRMVLHFMHAVTSARDRVHCFVFGTELTNISHYLRHRDVDEALATVGHLVTDWEGGTRIGHCLDRFNRDWSRRVLAQGAIVLLISDGLDRDNAEGLDHAMARLHRSARHLIWLNPLLRYAAYAPKSQGAQAMIRHVDEFRTVHNLASLEDLVETLSAPTNRRRKGTGYVKYARK